MKIAKKLTESLNHIDVIKGELQNKEIYRKIKSIPRDSITIGFKPEAINIIQKCTDDILNYNHDKFGPLYNYLNEKSVFEYLLEITSEIKQTSDFNKYNQFLSKIDQFCKDLKIQTFLCYIKIGNLITSKIYDFHSFKLFPNSIKYLEKLLPLDKPELPDFFDDLFLETDLYQTIMEIKIFAIDLNQAKIVTINQATDFLNIFRVMGAKGIFYEGNFDSNYHDVYILNSDTGEFSRTAQIENLGKMVAPFNLDAFEEKNPQILNNLMRIFNIEKSSQFERKILNSLIWLGESIYEPNFSHRLLKMIISLESLLLDSEDRGTKSYLLEERAALLLSSTYEARCLVADTIKEAYKVRNDIVHKGEKNPVHVKLIKYMLLFCYELNMKFLKFDKYKDVKDIKLEVRERKYQKLE